MEQPGNLGGSFFPEREILSSSQSWVSLTNISCWRCWTSPAKEDACQSWVSGDFFSAFSFLVLLFKLVKLSSTFFNSYKPTVLIHYGFVLFLIVREPDGGIKLYCKGADTVILERLQKDCPFLERTETALQVTMVCF